VCVDKIKAKRESMRSKRSTSKENTPTATTESDRLSDLSQLGAGESGMKSGWFEQRDHSITEISVLDQYVDEMMGFANNALDVQEDQTEGAATGEEGEEVRQSVKELVHRIESQSPKENKPVMPAAAKEMGVIVVDASSPPSKIRPPPRTKRKLATPDPSEDDLSRGVFTEVSFAGSFGSSVGPSSSSSSASAGAGSSATLPAPGRPPIPSPRTKRRNRKEQILLEHKERGREALDAALKKSRSAGCVPDAWSGRKESDDTADSQRIPSSSEVSPVKQASTTGLDCLDELCHVSRTIEREVSRAAKAQCGPESASDLVARQRRELEELYRAQFLGSTPEEEEKVRGD